MNHRTIKATHLKEVLQRTHSKKPKIQDERRAEDLPIVQSFMKLRLAEGHEAGRVRTALPTRDARERMAILPTKYYRAKTM